MTKLDALVSQMQALVVRAYDLGFASGREATVARVLAEFRAPEPPGDFNGYGSVVGAIRRAIASSGGARMSAQTIAEAHGMTEAKARSCIKVMARKGELHRVSRGWYVAASLREAEGRPSLGERTGQP